MPTNPDPDPEVYDKLEVYIEEMAPLIQQLYEIAQRENIPLAVLCQPRHPGLPMCLATTTYSDARPCTRVLGQVFERIEAAVNASPHRPRLVGDYRPEVN